MLHQKKKSGFKFVQLFLLLLIIYLLNPPSGYPEDEFAAYHDYSSLTRLLKQLVKKYPHLSQLESIGTTQSGHEIWALTISNNKTGAASEKAAVAVVGNIDGNHLIGSEIALFTASTLLDKYGKIDSVTQLLNQRTFYILPRINVDAAEARFQSPLFEQINNLTPTDDDYDGLVDEDGPEDLNQDGLITMMRFPDPKGTWISDSLDSSLWRQANLQAGEAGKYRLEIEGIDNDQDEALNEDPPGGVDLNQNFPQDYPQYQPAAGRFMLSESESRALVDFMRSHPNIALVLIYGRHDNLLKPPEMPRAKKEAATGRKASQEKKTSEPDFNQLAVDDIFIYQQVASVYKKITGLTAKSKPVDAAGAFFQWVYFQYGVPAFTTRIWWPPETKSSSPQNRPDSTQSPDEDSLKTAAEKMPKKLSKDQAPSDDLKWLTWIRTELAGEGFVPWQTFQHPTLGPVEIGGFKPYVQTNPPTRLIPATGSSHVNFTLYLSTLMPELKLKKVTIEKQTDSVYLLTVQIEKTGFLPDVTAFARQTKIVKPTIARLTLNNARLLTGTNVVYLTNLRLNGQQEQIEWLIWGEKGTPIQLEILSEKAGKLKQSIVLE